MKLKKFRYIYTQIIHTAFRYILNPGPFQNFLLLKLQVEQLTSKDEICTTYITKGKKRVHTL